MSLGLKITLIVLSGLALVLLIIWGTLFLPSFFTEEFATIDIAYDGTDIILALSPEDLLAKKPGIFTDVSIYWKNLSSETCVVRYAKNQSDTQPIDLPAGATADAHFFKRGDTVTFNFCGESGTFLL